MSNCMVRFLQTGDWQLGMARHFFSEGVQERYTQSRFDAIRTLGQIAQNERCEFIVVCGDIFESNQVNRKTVARTVEALRDIPVRVYILPGNHDPLDEASVYRSSVFQQRKPDHVNVIETARPIEVDDGIEIVGAPWASKRPAANPLTSMIRDLDDVGGGIRICLSHGAFDAISPNPSDPTLISLAAVEERLEHAFHYVAVGDRHSVTSVGGSGRIWYAGTPEPTDYDEEKPGFVLVVELSEGKTEVREIQCGTWQFVERKRVDLNSQEDLHLLQEWFHRLERKERTVARLRFSGTLSIRLFSQLEELLEQWQELLGALQANTDKLVIAPEDLDFQDLGLSGFASRTVERLRAAVAADSPGNEAASDALGLLLRLAQKTE